MQVGGRGPELCVSTLFQFLVVPSGRWGLRLSSWRRRKLRISILKQVGGRNWSAALELEAAKMQAKLFSLFALPREFPPNSLSSLALSIPFSRRFISIQFYNEISLPRVRYRKWNGQKSRTREGPKVGLRARMRQSRQIHSMNF